MARSRLRQKVRDRIDQLLDAGDPDLLAASDVRDYAIGAAALTSAYDELRYDAENGEITMSVQVAERWVESIDNLLADLSRERHHEELPPGERSGYNPSEPEEIHVVFDGPPSHESGRFVECEDAEGRGIKVGRWVEVPAREQPDANGPARSLWHLVFAAPTARPSDRNYWAVREGVLKELVEMVDEVKALMKAER